MHSMLMAELYNNSIDSITKTKFLLVVKIQHYIIVKISKYKISKYKIGSKYIYFLIKEKVVSITI